jgi:hypothetical protein
MLILALVVVAAAALVVVALDSPALIKLAHPVN